MAAEELAGVQASEDEIGICDGRLLAAACVADGTGHGAGAFGSDTEAAAGVYARQAAAAGADGVNVDDGQPQGEAGHFAFCSAGYAAGTEGDVGACAAHVEGDDTRALPARFLICP